MAQFFFLGWNTGVASWTCLVEVFLWKCTGISCGSSRFPIPSQFAKENKKFIYGVVKQGARAKDYELAIQWLIDAGLVYKISRVKTLGLPLKIHEDISAFKLYRLHHYNLSAYSGSSVHDVRPTSNFGRTWWGKTCLALYPLTDYVSTSPNLTAISCNGRRVWMRPISLFLKDSS